LPHETQGRECCVSRSASRRLLLSLALAPAVLLAGCAGGIDLRKAAVDDTIVTGSVSAEATEPADALLSDQSTVRDAVSSADPEALGEAGLAWANGRTGSRGTVTSLVEVTRKGLPCRRFVTTRESFDGVKRYTGEVCRVGGDLWRISAFSEG